MNLQLLSDCSTTALLILAQSGTVQTAAAVITRHNQILQHTNARICYIVVYVFKYLPTDHTSLKYLHFILIHISSIYQSSRTNLLCFNKTKITIKLFHFILYKVS